ncbi:MAG: hypothetical protein ACLGG0_12680 [Bacteriovoracia bacterium]
MLSTIFCVFSISVSLTGLHYSEAIENDGLTLCEVLDGPSKTCQDNKNSDNDNDHETVQVVYEIDSAKKFYLITPMASVLSIRLPEYKNSYLFAFVSQMIKPPNHLS